MPTLRRTKAKKGEISKYLQNMYNPEMQQRPQFHSDPIQNLYSYMTAAAYENSDADILHYLSQHPSVKGKIDPRALRVMLGAIRSEIGIEGGGMTSIPQPGFTSHMPDISPPDEYREPFEGIPPLKYRGGII